MTSPHRCHPCSPSAARTLPRKPNTAVKSVRKYLVDWSHMGRFWRKLCKLAKVKTAKSFFIENYSTMCSIHHVYHPQLNFCCHSLWIKDTPLHLSAIYVCPASITDTKPWHTVPLSPFCWRGPCRVELTMAHYVKLAVFSRIFCPDSVLSQDTKSALERYIWLHTNKVKWVA